MASATQHPPIAVKHRVLLVDTDRRVLQDVADALRSDGYDVLPAASFQEGKQLWMHHHPDVLVVDVRLGEFNGLQLLMRARADRPDLHAIITCPFADNVLEAEARRFGGDFLVKPIEPTTIVAAIGRSKPPQTMKAPAFAHFNAPRQHPPNGAATDERRNGDRRQVILEGFWPDRRAKERRSH